MSNFPSGRDKRSSTQVLLEPNDEAGELATYFQSENTLEIGHESNWRSWMDFIGLRRGGIVPKAIISILMLVFLLNVVTTFVNWRSISTSTWIEKTHLENSNASFSVRLEQLQTKLDGNFEKGLESIRKEFGTNLTNAQGKTLRILKEQQKRLNSTQNDSRAAQGKIQELQQQIENVDSQLNNRLSNNDRTSSKLSSGIASNQGDISKLGRNIDNFYRQLELHQNQSHGENGTGNFEWNFGNYTPETRSRLEFVQEVWREGKMELVVAQEISPKQHLQSRIDELKSNLEQLKTQPSRLDVEDRKVLFELLYNSSSIQFNRTDVCGGALNFSAPFSFRYEKLSSGPKWMPCVWVIWTNGSIKLQLYDLNGDLKIYNKFSVAPIDNRPLLNWTSNDVFSEKVMDTNMLIAVFTPSPYTSTDVMDIGLRIANPVLGLGGAKVSVTERRLTSTAVTLDSSGPYTRFYDHNQRQFYILYPPPGQKVRVSIQKVLTEANYDYLQLFKYDNSTQDFKFIHKFTGANSYLSGANYDGLKNQPMLMYFHTDGSTAHDGFTASVRSVSV